MCSLGNRRVNAILEYEVPEHVKKPSPSTPRSASHYHVCLSHHITVLVHGHMCIMYTHVYSEHMSVCTLMYVHTHTLHIHIMQCVLYTRACCHLSLCVVWKHMISHSLHTHFPLSPIVHTCSVHTETIEKPTLEPSMSSTPSSTPTLTLPDPRSLLSHSTQAFSSFSPRTERDRPIRPAPHLAPPPPPPRR